MSSSDQANLSSSQSSPHPSTPATSAGEDRAGLVIEVDSTGSPVVVRLSGDADLVSVDELEVEVNRLQAIRPEEVVFDFSELSHIASLAIGLLVALAVSVQRRGGRTRILHANPHVVEVLRNCRLDQVFELEN